MNTDLVVFMPLSVLILAMLLDMILGEPKRYHPLVGYGYLVKYLSDMFNRVPEQKKAIVWGGLAWCLAVIPLVAVFMWCYGSLTSKIISDSFFISFAGASLWQYIIDSFVLYLCIARKSLRDHILAVYRPLTGGDLTAARKSVSFIVSRDTRHLSEHSVRCATIESALENGADAIFAPIFWFLTLGAPGVLFYRLVNTLDAMWGYKNTEFLYFGKVAAHADDVMNWIPARLVAISYSLLGNSRVAWQSWRQQAPLCASPNAGPVMAAGAGALQIEVGGNAQYHGKLEIRPPLGMGASPNDKDILRTLQLIDHTLILWCSVSVVLLILIYYS